VGGTDAQRRLAQVPGPAPAEDEPPADDGEHGLFGRALELIRGEFEERTWQAFWLTAVEGREAPAAAAELGMSPVAVRIARSRVLARLRAEADELID